MDEFALLQYALVALRSHLAGLRRDERGMTTETVIITAVLAALALTAGAIIVAKVTGKANSIPTD
ncbi:MAG: hypothetical protein HYU28_07675 [Actinobacteria bacterium]|nr:hypothetical protein [Actinomycetota bacterium]